MKMRGECISSDLLQDRAGLSICLIMKEECMKYCERKMDHESV
jgi:hypothetical protein